MSQTFLHFSSSNRKKDNTHPKNAKELLRGFQSHPSPMAADLAHGVIEAHQIKISHLYDKLGCLSNSRTRLLPHQIEATHTVVSALRPRFLIADEVGLGKTIEAGLIIKELMLRKGMKRVLVIVPAPLRVQWQQEMRSKFNEEFCILDRRNFARISGEWTKHKKIITSIDFIKNDLYAERVLKLHWDIVIFDEAHRLRRDYSKVTKAYSFAERMSKNCDALLLLSATPFRGKLEELYFLIQLLDPHLLGPYHSFMQEYMHKENQEARLANLRARISKVMLRRRKVDVGGFTKRHARTIRFDLSAEERALYDATTDYVKSEYNLAQREKNTAVSFIMIVFQKLLDSSTQALLRALERRKTMLERRMFSWSATLPGTTVEEEYDLDDLLDETEEPDALLERFEDEVSMSLKDMRKEVLTLSWLIKLARKVKTDRKIIKLKETLERLKKQGSKKFIIFTQFRTSQDYIAEELAEEGYAVTVFHGSLGWKEKEAAIEEFRTKSDVLILTEAGGEGRNLQFTNILINYDLPWSPLKIEQRIGRVHRFGQDKDVYIFNFATADTVAERILEVLERKIHLFSETIGTPDILLGALEDEKVFQRNFMKFVTGQKSREELEAELEAKKRIAESGYKKLEELVTPHCVDFNLDDYYAFSKESRSIDNKRIEKITKKFLEMNPGSAWKLLPALSVKNEEPAFSAQNASADFFIKDNESSEMRPATFQAEKALENPSLEFLALGHPLVEEALAFFLKHPKRKQILCASSVGDYQSGFYFIFLCELKNGLERSLLLSCHVGLRGKCTPQQSILLPDASEIWMRHNPKIPEIETALEKAQAATSALATQKAEELKKDLHSIFKKEEYKIEISFGKKLRALEEKRDRQKMKLRLNPSPTNQALLTRTENEMEQARLELERKLYQIRQEAKVAPELHLLQVYVLGK